MSPQMGLRTRARFVPALLIGLCFLQPPSLGWAANLVTPASPGTCLTAAHPCVTFDLNLTRDDAIPLRGFSVTLHLSPELMLCSGFASITQGTYLSGVGPTSFQIIDNGGGSYTVDCAILGQPCGAVGNGLLFRVATKKAAGDGTGVLTVDTITLRDCVNQAVPGATGAPASVIIDYTPPVPVADLMAAQDLTGNGTDGTTAIVLSFTAPGDAAITRVYRAPYGVGNGSSAYPEYNDAPGAAAPSLPSYPPSAPWSLTAVILTGQADEPVARGYWYYAVFTEDACGNVSPVSNLAGGVLNYHLGDVSNGLAPCNGDNLVATADISLLGAHYGATLAYLDPANCLDVGPTADASPLTLPLTDNRLQFEDLMIFAMNYGEVSFAGGGGIEHHSTPRLVVRSETSGGEIRLHLRLEDNAGVVKGLHAEIAFDAGSLQLIEALPGELVSGETFFKALPEAPGVSIDLARLGSGATIAGSGEVATLRFRAGPGSAGVALRECLLRDADNQPIGLAASAPEVGAASLSTWSIRPNPMTREATIRFSLAQEGLLSLRVFDAAGREVRAWGAERHDAGPHEVVWNGRNDRGERVSPGVYFFGGVLDGRPFARKFIVLQ